MYAAIAQPVRDAGKSYQVVVNGRAIDAFNGVGARRKALIAQGDFNRMMAAQSARKGARI